MSSGKHPCVFHTEEHQSQVASAIIQSSRRGVRVRVKHSERHSPSPAMKQLPLPLLSHYPTLRHTPNRTPNRPAEVTSNRIGRKRKHRHLGGVASKLISSPYHHHCSNKHGDNDKNKSAYIDENEHNDVCVTITGRAAPTCAGRRTIKFEIGGGVIEEFATHPCTQPRRRFRR